MVQQTFAPVFSQRDSILGIYKKQCILIGFFEAYSGEKENNHSSAEQSGLVIETADVV